MVEQRRIENDRKEEAVKKSVKMSTLRTIGLRERCQRCLDQVQLGLGNLNHSEEGKEGSDRHLGLLQKKSQQMAGELRHTGRERLDLGQSGGHEVTRDDS